MHVINLVKRLNFGNWATISQAQGPPMILLTPPLNPLHTFEAAARHASFTLAAQELHVTQGAVSRQVRALEKYLGVELFERYHRSVRLTRAGRSFHEDLRVGFEQIETATGRLMGSRSRPALMGPASRPLRS